MAADAHTEIRIGEELRIQRYFLGDAGVRECAETRLHLETCANCRNLLATLQEERRTFLMKYPFREFSKRLPAPPPAVAWKTPTWIASGLAVALCLIFLPWSGPGIRKEASNMPMRGKGGPVVEFFYERQGQGPAQVGNASLVFREGDKIQFTYDASGYPYVALVSIDAAGKTGIYRRDSGSDTLSLATRAGDLQFLPFAMTLDESPRNELFLLVFSRKPLYAQPLETWLVRFYERDNKDLAAMELNPPQPDKDFGVARGILIRKAAP